MYRLNKFRTKVNLKVKYLLLEEAKTKIEKQNKIIQ